MYHTLDLGKFISFVKINLGKSRTISRLGGNRPTTTQTNKTHLTHMMNATTMGGNTAYD